MKLVHELLQHKGDHIWSVKPEDWVYDAIEMMAEREVGALLVMQDAKMVGIVSERDYARKVILTGRDSRDTPVSDIMTENVICVSSELRVDASMSIMSEKRVRHLVVRDEGRINGLISIGDVVKAVIDDQQFTIEQLEHYISGHG